MAFGRRATAEGAERARASVEVDRALAAFDGAAIVGTTHANSVELTVPGGACPTALVDMVGVAADAQAARGADADDGPAAIGHPRAGRAAGGR